MNEEYKKKWAGNLVKYSEKMNQTVKDLDLSSEDVVHFMCIQLAKYITSRSDRRSYIHQVLKLICDKCADCCELEEEQS